VKTDGFGLVLGFLAEGREGSCLDLAQVSDVRFGSFAKSPKDAKTREMLLEGSGSLDERLVSIAYGTNMVEINFINFSAPSVEVAKEFAAEVTKLAHNVFHSNDNVALLVRKEHAKLLFSADGSGRIPVRNVYNALLQHTKDQKKLLQSVLKQAGLPTDKAEFIEPDWFGFRVFYHIYCNYVLRRDVEVVFSKLSGGKKPHITLAQLRDYLNKTQRDPRLNEILYPYYTDDRVQALINQFEMNTNLAKKGHMTSLGFQKFLQSDENRPVDVMQLDLKQDMTQPLSHYFINSSHNTYLTGHQLTGKSSVEIYRQALLSGCRCVELDCWDGTGADQEPIITHGYTMCTDIVFKDVINAINETAFVTSDYPVILSFENHCSPKQQQKMAEHCRNIFKDKLLSSPYEDIPLQESVPLPSPERMRGKILIKNKKKREVVEEGKSEDGISKSKSFVRDDSGGTVTSDSSVVGSAEVCPEDIEKMREKAYTWEGQSETNLALAELVNYFTPVRFKSFDDALAKNRAYEMSSMSEVPAAGHLKQNPVEFVNYNKRQISRVYPKGSRYDSSNYMPQV
jgi:phosphatidylinositol phospholipase C beta